ncbi:MAG: Pyruvate, phosphate dikinase [Firmicutes bacterium ADurb.BinA205]|nr:MAG: Pyruvate, phosphate dikinase [Firmicutes bacterium ADurb.BinA205]
MSNDLKITGKKTNELYFKAFILGFLCIFLAILPIMISEKGYFIFYGDYNAQQIPFYRLAYDAARSGELGWNWFTDLGSDFMTSYSFYLFGSPFFRLATLLPEKLVTYSMPVLLAVKHGVASLTAYAYIRRFVRSKEAALTGGLLYAFSGFQLFNIFFNHFQDVTALFPLMLIAMEENINCRRKGVFALIVAVMAINNYYFFTGQAVFLVLYYLFRMMCPDFNTSWKKFFGLAFEAIAGTMLAGFILLPSALAILGNYRVSEHLFGQDMIIYSDKTLIPRIIQTFFMIPDAPARPNLFDSDYEKWASIGGFLPYYIEKKILPEDPFQVLDQEGIGQLVQMAVERGRSTRPDLKCGICGEHGGEPHSVKFCHRVGLNYVSCSPFRVPIARLAAAQAAIETPRKATAPKKAAKKVAKKAAKK